MKWNVFGKTYTDTHTHAELYNGWGQESIAIDNRFSYFNQVSKLEHISESTRENNIEMLSHTTQEKKKRKKGNIFLFLRTSAIDLVRIRTHTRAITISSFHWYIYEIELDPFRGREKERKRKKDPAALPNNKSQRRENQITFEIDLSLSFIAIRFSCPFYISF